jgi:hypothetical protein
LRKEVTLEDIAEVTELALQEAFFSAADAILLQRIGIPMGCPTSPAFAIAVCMLSEHQFHTSLKDVSRPLAGVRYFDDLLLWTLVGTAANGTILRGEEHAANQLLAMHSTIYHPSLRLVNQKYGPATLHFLEAIVHFNGDHALSLQYYNKNRESLLASTPGQTIQHFRHGSSMAPHGSLKTVVYSMLSRATQFETNPLHWVANMLLLLHEFMYLMYPRKILLQSLFKLSKNHPLAEAWNFVANFLQ